MAGTRCANPEYQLDVDTMMIEYLLYKGVDAQLQMLRALQLQTLRDVSRQTSPEQSYDISLLAEQAVSALRLTEMYDSLVTLYKKNHGDCLSEITQRNSRILRFLVQMNSWILSRIPELEELTPRMSSSMRYQQRRSILFNQSCRRIWLRANKEPQRPEYTEASSSWCLRNPQLSLADHLLPLFMCVSADLFKVSLKPPGIGLEWMRLAAHLMVQAAIEILDAPDLFASGPHVARNALRECFAWGGLEDFQSACTVEAIANEIRARGLHNTSPDGLDDVVSLEDSCQEMFNGHTNGENKSFSGSQMPTWDTIKKEAVEDVLMTFTSIQEAGANLSHRPLELLRDKYRLTALLADISDFIAIHWRLLHSRKMHKKPILVQIEEGGIDGLTLGEFEEFKQRARIGDMWDSMLIDEE